MRVFTKITRRDFLRQAGVGTGALVFGCHISPQGLLAEGLLAEKALNHFALIVPLHGTIIIMAHRSEMGQGIRSSLAAVLADELEADWNRVEVRQAVADGPRYALDNKFFIPDAVPPQPPHRKFIIWDKFSQFTDSSRSMALYYFPMRLFGAGIRLVLLRAAARKFGGVDLSECEARRHRVYHKPSGRSLDYGDLRLLLEAQKEKEPTQDEVTPWLKPSKKWHFIGNKDTMPFVDARDMVTGKAVYGADADPQMSGMLTASIERCPVANGTLVSFDPTEALAVPGVRKVLPVLPPSVAGAGGVGMAFLPHAGVAVVADNTWAAIQGRRKLKPTIQWDVRPAGFPLANADYQSDAYRLELEKSTDNPGMKLRSKGDVDAVFAQQPPTVERRYYVPHLAQAPMEPPAAIALFANGRWEIWAPTQSPDITQKWVGQIVLDVPQDEWLDLKDETIARIRKRVTVHVTLLGGGFGRKSKPDYVVEAALLAKQNPGVPIRVQWTREDDIKFSYYNAVSHQYLKAAVDGEGKATALLWRSAFTSFFATVYPPPEFAATKEGGERFKRARADAFKAELGDGAGGEYPHGSHIEFAQGLEDMPFEVANLRIENCEAKNHIRVGWMRSVANIYHAFAICSFADELAVAAGTDSKKYLLGLIGQGGPLDLKAEGVEHFDNNGFPVEPFWRRTPDGEVVKGPDGQPVPILFGYPPDSGRLRGVVERVAKNAGWDDKVKQYKAVPQGRGLGIAAHRSFLSYVAMVFDVSLSEPKGLNQLRELTIHDIYAVIDCGIAVNPDRVKAQMEGGIVYGLSLALLGEITVKGGAVEQNNFDDYPVLRIHQMPKNISIDIMEPPDPDHAIPTGVGEPPVPPVAPALANAIAAAGGPRIREVPFFRFVQVPVP
jgi:isoquinoline 1-oxidoreductase subunit beta